MANNKKVGDKVRLFDIATGKEAKFGAGVVDRIDGKDKNHPVRIKFNNGGNSVWPDLRRRKIEQA